MNAIQEAIARVTGLDDQFSTFESQIGELSSERLEIANVLEQLVADNALLQRQIEDLDYLNLYDFNEIKEVLPNRDRKTTVLKLRRLRHDNPLAKLAVMLVVRFTLGRGVQWVLASNQPDLVIDPEPTPLPVDQQPSSGILRLRYTDSTPSKNGKTPPTTPVGSEAVVPPGETETNDMDDPEDEEEKADPTREILESFWFDRDNKLAFTTHRRMQQMLDEVITDGEKFYAAFESDSAPYVRVSEIPLEEIKLIIYDPDNRLKPVFYKRVYVPLTFDGKDDQYQPTAGPVTKYYWDYRILAEDQPDLLKKIKIPRSKIGDAKIFHVMINELTTREGRRGVSELYASREWFRVFRDFMEGRAAINSAAQAISYVRKIKGGPTTVASFGGKFGGLNVGDTAGTSTTEIGRLTRPLRGAVYDSNQGVDLEWMKADTGAANAKEDAHLLLSTAGAGVGTMSHYFGEGGDANLATAQSMELPMVKSYEDWQQFIEDFDLDWFEYVIRVATGDPEHASEERLRIGHVFPPIISQDVVKYTTAWAQIVRDIAPNNKVVRRQAMRSALAVMGVPNIDALMPQIEEEMLKAEAQRKAQADALLNNLGDAANNPPPNNGNRPPVAGQVPNLGLDPNTKRIAAGNAPKVSNGPKQA